MLDLDKGTAALVRQLRHGRPQTLGYISRLPREPWKRRVQDPMLKYLLTPEVPPPGLSRPAPAVWLRRRWGIAFVIAAPGSKELAWAHRLGLPELARSDRSVVLTLPKGPVPPLADVEFGQSTAALTARGVFCEGLGGPEVIGPVGARTAGRWSGGEVTVLAPLATGAHRLLVRSPRAVEVEVAAGRWRRSARLPKGAGHLNVDLTAADRDGEGMVELHLRCDTFRPQDPRDRRDLGLFLVKLERVAG